MLPVTGKKWWFSLFSQNHRNLDRPGGQNLRDRVKVSASGAENAKFHPVGDRGVDGGCLDGDYYRNFNLKEYTDHYNRETVIAVQIETPQAVDNIEEIAAVNGLDVLFVGPSDLSMRLGCPSDLKDPRFLEAQEKVSNSAEKNGLRNANPFFKCKF